MARALHFQAVKVVVNYDIPERAVDGKYTNLVDRKSYLYRMGRAFHMGKYSLLLAILIVQLFAISRSFNRINFFLVFVLL